jgi:N-acetylglucosamine-6-phosphate deacetylase
LPTAFTNATIFTGYSVETNKAVLSDNGRIIDIIALDSVPSQFEKQDLGGLNLSPSFIDLQIYGGNGKMFSHELNDAALHVTREYCLEGGCSYFMITMATNTIEKFLRGIDAVRNFWESGGKGLLGLHLEGPYINPAKRGAHIAACIKKATIDEVKMLLDKGNGVIKMMTLAPELCDDEIIELLLENNIIVSAGHTNANYQQARKGFANGIPAATHLFNAMSPLQHREPGMVGAIMDHSTVVSSIVCDGIHVDYAAVRVAKKIMHQRLFYITDAVTEIKTGEYQHIFQGDRYTLPDGTLSGSSLTMMECVKNGVEKVGIPLDESLRMATDYPAQLLKGRKIGRIEKDYEASFVVFDNSLNLVKIY